jgi:hypothetical protein
MQLNTLKDVYAHDGPFVTVHLDVSRNTEDAPQQLEARWTTARHTLEQEKVDPGLVEQIGQRLQEPTELPGQVRRTIIAADGEIVFDDARIGSSPWPETVTCGDLPDLAGWVHQSDGQIPFLLVVADREGADLELHEALDLGNARHSEVSGETLHLHKYQGGGWSHRRFQQRSENTAENNARQVADEIRSIVTKHKPRAVLLAGDPRPRSVIAESLQGVPCEVHQLESGGRAAGSSEESLREEVAVVLARLEAEDQQEVAGRLEERWAQGAGAVLGVDDVLEALVQGKVETLVVDLQRARDLTVEPARFPGLPIPQQAAVTKELPADQVLVAAGAATDASLVVLPTEQGKGGGVAAVLRWDDRDDKQETV